MNILIRWLLSPRDFSLVCIFKLRVQSMRDSLDVWKPEMQFLCIFLSFGISTVFSFKHRHWILWVALHYPSLYMWSHIKVPKHHLYILLLESLQEIMDLIKKNTWLSFHTREKAHVIAIDCLIWQTEGGLQDNCFFLAMKRKNNKLLMRLY